MIHNSKVLTSVHNIYHGYIIEMIYHNFLSPNFPISAKTNRKHIKIILCADTYILWVTSSGQTLEYGLRRHTKYS